MVQTCHKHMHSFVRSKGDKKMTHGPRDSRNSGFGFHSSPIDQQTRSKNRKSSVQTSAKELAQCEGSPCCSIVWINQSNLLLFGGESRTMSRPSYSPGLEGIIAGITKVSTVGKE